MPRDRSLVRASDVGAWHFCHRAWWLANVAEAVHEDPQMLEVGNRAHAAHGRSLRLSQRLRTLGLLLMAAGLITLGLLLLVHALSG